MTMKKYFERHFYESYTKGLQSGLITKTEGGKYLAEAVNKLQRPWECDKAFDEGRANGIAQALGKNQAYFLKDY